MNNNKVCLKYNKIYQIYKLKDKNKQMNNKIIFNYFNIQTSRFPIICLIIIKQLIDKPQPHIISKIKYLNNYHNH